MSLVAKVFETGAGSCMMYVDFHSMLQDMICVCGRVVDALTCCHGANERARDTAKNIENVYKY